MQATDHIVLRINETQYQFFIKSIDRKQTRTQYYLCISFFSQSNNWVPLFNDELLADSAAGWQFKNRQLPHVILDLEMYIALQLELLSKTPQTVLS